MANHYEIVAYRPKNNREIEVTYKVYQKGHDVPLDDGNGLVSTLISAFGEKATEDLFKSPSNIIGTHEVEI